MTTKSVSKRDAPPLPRTDAFLEYRRSHHDLAKQHDDRLLWACGGLFVASVTLLTAAWSSRILVDTRLLIGAWVFLALALVVVLGNFQLAMECEQRNMDEEENRTYDGYWTSTRLLDWIGWCNRWALGCFLVAAILFLFFTSSSLRGLADAAGTQAKAATASTATSAGSSIPASGSSGQRSP
jgi:hypothetical protein